MPIVGASHYMVLVSLYAKDANFSGLRFQLLPSRLSDVGAWAA